MDGEDAVTEAERAPLALAAPTAAMSARLTSKLYLPTALVAMQLPAGLADLQTVPRLLPPDEWHDEEARLQEYVEAIRATARVFATYNHKMETLASYDAYMVWIDGWARHGICRGSSMVHNQGMVNSPARTLASDLATHEAGGR